MDYKFSSSLRNSERMPLEIFKHPRPLRFRIHDLLWHFWFNDYDRKLLILLWIIIKNVLGPTEKWLKGFVKRHPIVSQRTPESVTRAAANVNSLNITIWFEKLTAYLEQKNLLEFLKARPSHWLNLDESGIDLNAMPKKVFTTKRVKHTYRTDTSKHNTRITITMCISADGSILTPQVIFPTRFSRINDAAYAAGGNFWFFRILGSLWFFSCDFSRIIFIMLSTLVHKAFSDTFQWWISNHWNDT